MDVRALSALYRTVFRSRTGDGEDRLGGFFSKLLVSFGGSEGFRFAESHTASRSAFLRRQIRLAHTRSAFTVEQLAICIQNSASPGC